MNYQKTFTVGIYTLGCKVNQYESEAIAEALEHQGVRILPPDRPCDAYIINTCTVTAESDRKARQVIRRAIAKNPAAYVAVTGCLAQTSAEAVAAIEGVDLVVGNQKKMAVVDELLHLLRTSPEKSSTHTEVPDLDGAAFEPMSIASFGRTRAYVKIEDGCENRCTYCMIPNARGNVRSKPAEDVVREVGALCRNGCREVVLTGIETASWGKDFGKIDLASLLEQVDRIENIGRVRLGSLDPSLIRPEFVRRIAALPSLAPHFHLSLQSGSSRILAAMKRKYNAEMAAEAVSLLRQAIPRVKFTTDVIVGFPGETEEDFEETVRFVRQAQFLTVHIFPYSKRKGTPAATFPDQVPEAVKHQRLHRLEEVAAQVRRQVLEEAVAQETMTEVLFETFKNGKAVGHTDDFLEVSVPAEQALNGQLLPVRLLSTDGAVCFGEILNP